MHTRSKEGYSAWKREYNWEPGNSVRKNLKAYKEPPGEQDVLACEEVSWRRSWKSWDF